MTGQLDGLDPTWVDELRQLERAAGFPFVINSGYRNPDHNAEVGGVHDSAHTESPGRACDIAVLGGGQRYAIVKAALAHGIRRIGVGKTFVHLDRSPALVQPVLWEYSQ